MMEKCSGKNKSEGKRCYSIGYEVIIWKEK